MSFNNVVNLFHVDSGSGVQMPVITGPTDRRTVRAMADGGLTLTIASQDTTENKGFVTQRTVVRLDGIFPVAESAQTVKAYAQFTISAPKVEVTAEDVSALVARLVNFLVQGESPTAGDCLAASEVLGVTRRLLGGES